MNVWRILCLLSVSSAILLLDGAAAAQDIAVAEALFNKGVAEMEAGHFAVACLALAESQRHDPRPGTLFTLAECHGKAGKIAAAVAVYEDYLHAVGQLPQADKLRHQERATIATERKAALAAEIPELTLTLPTSAPKDVKIACDGVAFTAASLGVGLPLDPGEHVLTTRVGSGPAHEQRVTLARWEKKSMELAVKLPGRASAAAPGANAGSATAAAAASAQEDGGGMSGARIGALIAGGVGVAGLTLGGIAGGVALSKKSVIEEHCQGDICDAEGKAAAEASKVPGLLSTIGFGVGAAGVAAGVVLWLTGNSAPAETGQAKRGVKAMVDAGPGGAALGVKGVW